MPQHWVDSCQGLILPFPWAATWPKDEFGIFDGQPRSPIRITKKIAGGGVEDVTVAAAFQDQVASC